MVIRTVYTCIVTLYCDLQAVRHFKQLCTPRYHNNTSKFCPLGSSQPTYNWSVSLAVANHSLCIVNKIFSFFRQLCFLRNSYKTSLRSTGNITNLFLARDESIEAVSPEVGFSRLVRTHAIFLRTINLEISSI